MKKIALGMLFGAWVSLPLVAHAQEAPRGLAPLGLLQKAFKGNGTPGQPGLDSIADLVGAAKNPEVAFLFTTFGTTYENASAVVKPLIAAGKAPRVAIYLENGPGRRNESRRPHISFHPELRPDAFKAKLLANDKALLADLDAQVIAPTLAFMKAMNDHAAATGKPQAKFVVIPELEDNFGNQASGKQAFGNLLARIRAGLKPVANVSYRRNPLVTGGTFDSYRVGNLPFEAHTYQTAVLDQLKKGDTTTGDGAHFVYPEEGLGKAPPIMVNEPVASFSDMKRFMAAATKKQVGVLLWRAEWQGLTGPSSSGDPGKRKYSFPKIGTSQHGRLRELITGVASGLPAPKPTTTEIKPNGTKVDGVDGFLWKPVSDSTGKLVVLCPKVLTGNVRSVIVKDASGKKIETGVFKGVANGDREHFRFNRSGSNFPKNCVCEVTLEDRSVRNYLIPDPAQRYD